MSIFALSDCMHCGSIESTTRKIISQRTTDFERSPAPDENRNLFIASWWNSCFYNQYVVRQMRLSSFAEGYLVVLTILYSFTRLRGWAAGASIQYPVRNPFGTRAMLCNKAHPKLRPLQAITRRQTKAVDFEVPLMLGHPPSILQWQTRRLLPIRERNTIELRSVEIVPPAKKDKHTRS